MSHRYHQYPGYLGGNSPDGSFDVQWRHFQPQLSISGLRAAGPPATLANQPPLRPAMQPPPYVQVN